ncbi:hypothetical protein [Nostoc sp. CCY0012]|uniref:hypothetical protein n=1 Tax=Nostoc sp. CCY0012 TaxID=1056123 RepID=UPI0039C5AA87
MKKLGIVIIIAFASTLTACFQNSQADTPPISHSSPKQAKSIAEVPPEQPKLLSNPPHCDDGCQTLDTDTSFSESPIKPELIAYLPTWENICKKTQQQPYCTILKPYQFADGIVYLKVSSTESFAIDIHFTSGIDRNRAMSIVQAAVNSQDAFEKTEETKDKIILYGGPFDDGNEIYYLAVTELILNAQNQVTQITSVSTTP